MSDIRKFINIIDEDPEQVRQEINKKVDKIPDEDDLKDVLKFTNRYSIKKDVEKFTTLRDYKGLVSSVFLQALADASVPDADVKKFLKQLSGPGILDVKKLLTPRVVHSYSELIDSTYQKTFDSIKVDLFSKIAGKIGEKGDVGKGEYMLDIISPDVQRRGAPGDLDIKGTKIELKAGQNGRLGPAGSQALVGRFVREYAPYVQKLVPGTPVPTDSASISKIFNPKLDMSAFTEYFGDAKRVKMALEFMMKMHYPGYDVKSMVSKVVDGSGNINGAELKKQMLKASYEVYQAEKEFDGVIIMDAAVTGFLYVKTGDDLAAAAGSLLTSFPSWTDTQSNCMKISLSGTSLKAAGAGGAGASKSAEPTKPKSKIVNPETGRLDTQKLRPGAAAADVGRSRRTGTTDIGRSRR